MELQRYEISIDLEDEATGLDANSGVYNPAHERLSMTFNKDAKSVKFTRDTLNTQIKESFNKTMKFNDDDQTVYGVAIAADVDIYRNDGDEEYSVFFTKKGIADIIHDYSRKENFNKFNVEHNSGSEVDGVYMVMSYQIDKSKGHNNPEAFKDETDGTWILGYKIINQDVYNKFKSGEIRGFSVEGTFILEDMEFSKVIDRLEKVVTLLENKQNITSNK